VPTAVPSISTFADPAISRPFDPERNPSQAAALWLRRDIVRGVFEPLERLKVEHLAQFYGVGHSPAREAIIFLSSTGLVIHEHLKGYRVAPVSLADYDDVLGVYHRLYKLALDIAMDVGDQAWEERVVVQLHRSLRVAEALPNGSAEDRERWQRAYGMLHAELLSGCGSPLMMRMFEDIGGRLERYVHLFADLTNNIERDIHAEHREIVDAVLSRDHARVPQLVDRYIAIGQPVRNSIVASLKREQAPPRRKRRSAEPAAEAAQ
jgi:GntR family carbon starvation induced transcriptional regulator